jgi:hypothetical protein
MLLANKNLVAIVAHPMLNPFFYKI